MKVILYRYHTNPEICKDRLSLIKKFNKDVPVYGLYGGKEEEFEFYARELKNYLTDNYCIRGKSDFWKWKNSDLAYCLWYKDFGFNLNFDSVVVLEWDLIFFDSVENLYKHVKDDQVGFTGLVELSKIEKKWFWTRDEEQRKDWLQLLQFVKEKYHYSMKPYGGLCPGVHLPKRFLAEYSKTDVPELCHDELRLPLFAQILGFELVDNGYYTKWFSKREWKFFNANNMFIKKRVIEKQLSRKKGRRVFHPFRDNLDTIDVTKLNK